MKREGYTNRQIAEMEGVSEKTVARSLKINTAMLCTDGSSARIGRLFLDQYKAEIQALVEMGFKPTQILKKLQANHPEQSFKRTTVNDYCLRLRGEQYDLNSYPAQSIPELSKESKIYPYKDEIQKLYGEQNPVTKIFEIISDMGYTGSYTLLLQYCDLLKPTVIKTKKSTRSISRKSINKMIWGRTSTAKYEATDAASEYSSDENKYADFLYLNFPEYGELETIIREFRVPYANRDIGAVERWVDTYAECKYQGIKSFINGIKNDSFAFYNSMKSEFNNGLLEGFVNKLKEVKRSMFGRASYSLLRAKMLLLNSSELMC